MRFNRRLVGLAAGVFLCALGLGYATSSSGQTEEAPEPIGAPAVALDVPAAAKETGLGETAALPAMARRPPPPAPAPEPVETETDPDLETTPEDEPFFEEPAEPAPPIVTPEPVQPAPEPPPDPVQFDDEG